MAKNTADYIWFNGEMKPWADANVHVLSHALHYGTSVFEGIRCYDTPNGSVVFRHKEHMQRLKDSAKIYRFPLNYSVEELMQACRDTLKANHLKSAYIRPIGFVGDVGLGVCPPEGYDFDLAIAAFEWGAYLGDGALAKGVEAMVSSWTRMAPNTIPAMAKAGGNYLSSLLIGSEARRQGFSEGISLDVNGHVAECSGENVFVIKNGIIYTPASADSILLGITRDSIMTLAKDLGMEVREQPMTREFLYIADEVFMCGTAAEITPVSAIDKIQIGEGCRGPVTEKIQKAFFGLFDGTTEDKYGWLDPVNQ